MATHISFASFSVPATTYWCILWKRTALASYRVATGMLLPIDVPKAHRLPWVVYISTRSIFVQDSGTAMSQLAFFAHGEDAICTATCAVQTSSLWAAKAMTKYWNAATTVLATTTKSVVDWSMPARATSLISKFPFSKRRAAAPTSAESLL